MKQLILLLFGLLIFVSRGLGQDFSYQSTDNPYYWKNRKPHAAYWQQDVSYKIYAELNDETDVVKADEALTYTNNSPDTLYFVYFHLYQNAFVKGGYLEQLNLANNFKQKFGKYETAGLGTVIQKVVVGGISVKPTIDFSIMKIELPKPLLPNQKIEIFISFVTYFDDGGNQRRRMKMFKDNEGNKQYDGVHWYPRICVYDRKFGWETDQHLGKEFYGDFGEFEISLTLPSHYIMDATGELQNEAEVLPTELRKKLDISNFKNKPYGEAASVIIPKDGNTKTWKFRAVNTHDFAWTADPTFRIGEYVLEMPGNPRGKVRCISLAQEPHASGWQDAAKFNALIIQTYSKDFGTYAYPKMIVADARDGMEYPMLTLDNGSSPGYYGLFAHEIGHNWFFGMVGNNETYRASLDEGFTQFLTHWSMSRLTREAKPAGKGKGYRARYYKPMSSLDQTVMMGYLRDAINNNDMPLNTHSDDFNGALHHGGGYGHVYYKTATMLYNLQYVLGDELFLKALQHYFNQWKMAHPYFEDFRNSIIQYTHVDLNWFFDQWMESTKTIDYGIKKVKRLNADTLAITFQRKGLMQMPLDFTVINKDSQIQNYVLPNTWFNKTTNATTLAKWTGWGMLNTTHTALIPFKGELSNIIIDPSKRLADVNLLNNSFRCPTLFTFDHQIASPINRHEYLVKMRPELWYNNYDGIKAGVHLNGNYMNLKHVFKATIWYNTGLLTNRNETEYTKYSAIYPIHYSLSYKHRIYKFLDIHFHSRMLDGLMVNRIGIENIYKNSTYRIYAKSSRRMQPYYMAMQTPFNEGNITITPQVTNLNAWVNTLNIEWEKPFSYWNGNAKLTAYLRGGLPFSDLNFGAMGVTLTQSHPLHKFELRTRLFAATIGGSNAPNESMIYAAGANPEEMAENKFARSPGIIPEPWFNYTNNYNHFQMGGGLNLRGFAGYFLPSPNDPTQFLYKGNNGAAINAELDFDKYINFKPASLSKYFHLDLYLFGDAGTLVFKDQSTQKSYSTNLIACAGAGAALTIKKFGILDDPKPLTIRFDVPAINSIATAASPEYIQFRWIVGIGRSF